MFKTYVLVLFLVLTFASFGQIRFSDAELIVQSRHVWRGEKLGTAPSIEPSVTFYSGQFSLNIWAAQTLDNSYSEINLVPAFQFKHFQLTIFDYYNPVPEEKNSFFIFQEGKSRHSVELTLDNYSVRKQKLKWMIGAFLMGDKNKATGHPFFSSYLEFSYPFTVSEIEISPFLGLTPFRGYYADRFAVINSGISFSKSFKISSVLSIPIKASYIFNPNRNNQFFVIASGIAINR